MLVCVCVVEGVKRVFALPHHFLDAYMLDLNIPCILIVSTRGKNADHLCSYVRACVCMSVPFASYIATMTLSSDIAEISVLFPLVISALRYIWW